MLRVPTVLPSSNYTGLAKLFLIPRGILCCDSYRKSGFDLPREFKSCLDVSTILFLCLLSPGLTDYYLRTSLWEDFWNVSILSESNLTWH